MKQLTHLTSNSNTQKRPQVSLMESLFNRLLATLGREVTSLQAGLTASRSHASQHVFVVLQQSVDSVRAAIADNAASLSKLKTEQTAVDGRIAAARAIVTQQTTARDGEIRTRDAAILVCRQTQKEYDDDTERREEEEEDAKKLLGNTTSLNTTLTQNTTACPPGQILTASGVCVPCAAGSSCGNGKPKPCAAGTYAAAAGSSSCTSCAAGKYSAAGATSCTDCGVGTSSLTRSASCTKCLDNWYSPTAAGLCVPCAIGTKSVAGSASCTPVNPCTDGTNTCGAKSTCIFAGTGGQYTCKCAAGYSSLNGRFCAPCAAGYSCNPPQAPTVCPAGTASLSGQSSCTKCEAGKFASSGAATCTDCPQGTFSKPGSTTCGTTQEPGAQPAAPCLTGPGALNASLSSGESDLSEGPSAGSDSESGSDNDGGSSTGGSTGDSNGSPSGSGSTGSGSTGSGSTGSGSSSSGSTGSGSTGSGSTGSGSTGSGSTGSGSSGSGSSGGSSGGSSSAIAWTVARRAPEWGSTYTLENAQSLNNGKSYLGPDQQNGNNNNRTPLGGNGNMYAVLDLGSSHTVDKLQLDNGHALSYTLYKCRVTVGDNPASFTGSWVTADLQGNSKSLQDVTVGQTGRYVRIDFEKYGYYSVGLRYIGVIGH